MAEGAERPLNDFVRQHPSLIATGAVVVLFVIRLFGMTNGSITTTLGLLSSAGPVEVAFGTLVALFPAVLYVVSLVVIVTFLDVIRGATRRPAWLEYGLWILVFDLLYLTVSFWIVLALVVLVFSLPAWLRDRSAKKRGVEPPRDHIFSDTAVIISTVLSLLVSSDDPWTPAEVVRAQNQEAVVAYVVDAAEGWTTLMLEEDRALVRVPTEDILKREVCVLPEEASSRTVGHFLGDDPPEYPQCDA